MHTTRLVIGLIAVHLSVATCAGQVWIAEGHGDWSYSHANNDKNWSTAEFDASDWKRGPAPLGFGEPEIATITLPVAAKNKTSDDKKPIDKSPNDRTPDQNDGVGVATQNRPITGYFRTGFDVAEPNENRLHLKIRVDDGFVAYLNGTEVQRWNLPDGAIDATTTASQSLGGESEALYHGFVLPQTKLREGKNVLAIEVHQSNAESSDLFLDARLYAVRDISPQRARVDENALQVTHYFNMHHNLDAKTRVPDGFLDGGRGMQVDEFGNAVSDREVVRVDRTVDERLKAHLGFARSAEIMQLNPVDRATRIAHYIDQRMTPPDGRDSCVMRSNYLAERYASTEVLLGDAADLCGGGVCRHRSLLFKLMGDEAGLDVSLVRGNYGKGDQAGGHAWNELHLSPDKTVIVDVMNPQPDFYFPTVGERSLRFYLTIAGAPKYFVDDVAAKQADDES